MGELLSKERELALDLRSDVPQDTPWDDEHLEAEQRERNEDVRGSRERIRSKREPSNAKDDRSPQRTARSGVGPTREAFGDGTRPARLGRRPSDGFELGLAVLHGATASTALSGASRPAPLPPSRMKAGALHVLDDAREPGVLFRAYEQDERTDEAEDPELAEAVEEAIRLLFGVRGIHHIGPGRDEAGTPVVLVSVNRGFGEASLRKIPERVHRFRTLVALPYELLPLRRE